MGAISNDWLKALNPEFAKPYYAALYKRVKDEYSRYLIYPPADDIFNAFHFTPLSKVKVVILGRTLITVLIRQHGCDFSVKKMLQHRRRLLIFTKS